MFARTSKENLAQADPVLERIKKDVFRGLKDYAKCFPDLELGQLSDAYSGRPDAHLIDSAIAKALQVSENFLIYVHLPFCIEQCSYCNTSTLKSDSDLQETYLKYLFQEIGLLANTTLFNNKKVIGVYLGGGTPTCLSASGLTEIIDTLRDRFNLAPDCHLTCELHPLHACGRRGRETISNLKRAGLNRLSMGVQTFDPKILHHCARHHTPEDIKDVMCNIRDFQLDINIDMMIGLPGQTPDSLKYDLEILSETKPDAVEYMRHGVVNQRVMSLYSSRPELATSKDALFEMNLLFHSWMAQNGYEQNGSYAPGSQFFPYRNFWLCEVPYLALGSGARSHWAEVSYTKPIELGRYFSALDKNEWPLDRFRLLSVSEKIFRTLFLRLQLAAGVGIDELRQRYGSEGLALTGPLIEALKGYHLATDDDGIIRLTNTYGRYFVEDICHMITVRALSAELRSKFHLT
jgi:oxygen-independent coproporphyrinogen-3 oxidase